jgi:hypothetical protein
VQSSLEHLFYLSSSPKGASRHSQRSPADHGSTFSGVFFDDISVGDKHQDIVRMALFKSRWLQIFSRDA